MDSRCSICHNSSQALYCAHCISSSPKLLLRMKINLMILQDDNTKLKNKVENILDVAMNRNENHNKKNTEGIILGQKLQKIDVLKHKRRNNKIKFRINQLSERIQKRRNKLENLKQELLTKNVVELPPVSKKEAIDIVEKLEQFKKVVTRTQESEYKFLINWFNIRKRNSYDVSYTLAFLPVISLKNFPKLPRPIAISSINKMSQFLKLYSQIIALQLKFQCDQVSEINDATDNDIVKWISRLVINILQLARFNALLPEQNIDLVWLLDQYDIDSLFYNLVMNHKIECRVIDYTWSYDRILEFISKTLQLSVQSTFGMTNKQMLDTPNTDADMWYIVG